MIVCDTGPLVASVIRRDDGYRACTELFTGLHLAGRDILVPGPVIAEVGYLIAHNAGAAVEAAFLRSFGYGTLTMVDLQVSDLERMADLVETYADFPLGTTDAAVIAVAERLNVAAPSASDRKNVASTHGPASHSSM